jgi:hypothetical protein
MPTTTVHDPFDFVCGMTWEMSGPLEDADGNPLNLTGAQIAWRLESLDGLARILELTLGAGITVASVPLATILVQASTVQTAAVPPGTYKDWLIVTLLDGRRLPEWTGVIRAAAAPV